MTPREKTVARSILRVLKGGSPSDMDGFAYLYCEGLLKKSTTQEGRIELLLEALVNGVVE